MRNIISLVLVCALLGFVASQQCSSSSPCTGTPQPCCSNHGWCGTTSSYCGSGNCTTNCWTGCQLGGSSSCPAGQCCSQYGYCGTTAVYCSPANNCFSNCWTSTTTTGSSSTTGTPTPPSSKVFVAYIPSWMTGFPAPCNLNLNTLNVAHFTHLLVPFVYFDTTNFVFTPQNGDDTSGWYAKVLNLKNKNSKLKVMISIGGGGFGGAPWATMVSTTANQNKFITNAINFARSHSFDGLDIDWEAPDSNSQTPQIAQFLSAFRAAITRDASSSGKPALLLTLASPNYQFAIKLFNFTNTAQYLDWINVMNYDYYGEWSSAIGANTAFSGSAGLDITATFFYFSGVPSSKLAMGFANYARTFNLKSASQNTPGSPFSSLGAAGPCSSSAGTYTYYEVGNYIATHPSGVSVYDSVSKTPYFYFGTQWVTYDNAASLQVKLNYVNSQGLRGAMIWALDGNSTITDAIASGLGL